MGSLESNAVRRNINSHPIAVFVRYGTKYDPTTPTSAGCYRVMCFERY